uniref:Uncharacterized protein n=1 Tax=Setaria digitata TaxID=48799 RepID=A0A915PTD7_9BILA
MTRNWWGCLCHRGATAIPLGLIVDNLVHGILVRSPLVLPTVFVLWSCVDIASRLTT